MPVNYQMDVINPFEAALKGYGAGAQMLQQEQAAKQQQVQQGQQSQLFGLQVQEAQGRLATIQAEKDKAARAQKASTAVYDMLDKPDWAKTVTAGDIARVMEGNPELGKYLTTERARLNDEQKLNGFNQNWSVAAALELGNTGQAEALLENQAAAFETSDPKKAATLRGMKEQLKTPEGRDIIKKSLLVNASLLMPEQYDKLRTGLVEAVKLPLEMKLAQAQIDRERAAARLDARRAEVEAAGGKVQSSTIIPDGDGTAIMLMTDGSRKVLDPQGNLVTGEAAAQAIAKANQVAIETTSQKAGGRQGAKFGQDIAKDAFVSLGKVRSNMLNLDKVVTAIDSGADTGLIQSQLPATNAATLELRQMQSMLGLDVVGSTTFGALSEGELKLALDVALPAKMERADLRAWVFRKKAAQQKLAGYMEEQAKYLSIPGHTVGDWLTHLESMQGGAAPAGKTGGGVPDGSTLTRDANGKLVLKQ